MERGQSMLLDIVIVLLAATGTVFLIRFVFGLMLMPVRGRGCRVSVLLSVKGDTPDVDRVLKGAKWLSQQGGVRLIIVENKTEGRTSKAIKLHAKQNNLPTYTVEDVRENIEILL